MEVLFACSNLPSWLFVVFSGLLGDSEGLAPFHKDDVQPITRFGLNWLNE